MIPNTQANANHAIPKALKHGSTVLAVAKARALPTTSQKEDPFSATSPIACVTALPPVTRWKKTRRQITRDFGA